MSKSPGRSPDPAPGAYRPHVAARRPGGRPSVKPAFRVLVHHRYLELWNELPSRVGLENAQQFWDHVAMTPGEPPKVGTSSVMKGKHAAPKWPGYSKTVHYEVTGAGRIDYQFNPRATEGVRGDPHGVVKILTIDLSSH
ncbi:MAG: hypothetical protein ACYCXN_10350 [Acidimicrobiales bacterium]